MSQRADISTKFQTEVRELDRRTNDGVTVTLLWNPRTDRVFIAVEDERRGDAFRMDVAASDALEAFHHPYAYASRHHDDDVVAAERMTS